MTLGASFGTTSDWGLGFVADVRVQPLDHDAGTGWTVAFDAAFDITQLWNATVLAHEGQHWVLGNLDWNAVPGPDGVTFGFQGKGSADVANLSAAWMGVAVAPAVAPVPAPAAGANTLVLKISEDAWQGDAQYRVAVDGVQVGGVLTATATPGAPQDVVLHGNWGSGPHTVTVNFLNDAWGGTPDTDRNLHVEGISYDGIAVGGAILFSAGAKDFAIPGAAAPVAAGYLHTQGTRIVDDAGQDVVLKAVAWTGMETPDFAPHGLQARNWHDMMDQMKALGFNTIRLPFSSDLLHTTSAPKGIDYGLNPDLAGLSGLQILDRIVDYAGRIGLHIVLDHHLSTAGYGTLADNPLWYDNTHADAQWVADWQALALRYAGAPAVVGADLHNEPFGSSWGDGSAKDWRAAAERAGDAILAVNPNWLIVVEGNWTANSLDYWWGGNLTGVATAPVRLALPGHLVYSPHDYGNSVWPQPFFHTADFPDNLPAIFERFWGFIGIQSIGPLWLGEFGSNLTDPLDVQWFSQLSAYLAAHGIGFSWWAFDPSSTDVGGILEGDWRTPDPVKMAALRPLLSL